MGKIIIVFYSPNEGDKKDWEKVIQRDNKCSGINGDKIYVNPGKCYLTDNLSWDIKKIDKRVDEIIKIEGNASEYAIMIHAQMGNRAANQMLNKLKSEFKQITFISFSKGGISNIDFNKYIKPFCDNPCSKTYNELWSELQKKSAEDLADKAHKLRSEILTPFIPFHLFHQLDNKDDIFHEWENILNASYEAINNSLEDKKIENKLNEILNMKEVPSGIKELSEEVIKQLRHIINIYKREDIKKEDCIFAIESFATSLENIVNYIEFGEAASCQ